MRPLGIIRLLLILSLSLGTPLVPGQIDVSLADSNGGKGVDLVAQASKAYSSGDYSGAAALIDAAFKAGLTGELAARAILLRAQINEQNGKLAGALQDYSNALWMESLPPPERKVATEGKARVMAAMGLSAPTSSAGNSATVQARPAERTDSSSGGVFGMFNGIFGSSGPSKPAAAQPSQPQTTWQTSTATPSEASETHPKKTAASVPAKPAPAPKPEKPAKQATVKVAAKAAPSEPAAGASVASSSEGFLIVFGSVNSEQTGRAKAQQIKAQLSDILVSRNLDVEANPSGGFLIVAGPYKVKSAALALCSAMKQRGVACQVTP